MANAIIKFSHNYPKLHGQTSAELLAVRPIRIDKNTPDELLEYDTTYLVRYNDETLLTYKARFPLQAGDYIQLIFLGNLRIPFCTIRKNYPPQKGDYYRGKIGDIFTIEIKEPRHEP